MADLNENIPLSPEQLILLIKIHNADNMELEEPDDFLAYYTEEESVFEQLEEMGLTRRSPMNPEEPITTHTGDVLLASIYKLTEKYT